MAVVRPHRRRPAWLPAAVVAATIVLVTLVAAALLRTRSPAPASADVSSAVPQMVAELDVLAISLYTDETVRDGTVLRPEEYAAARTALERVRTQWERVRQAVPETRRERVDSLLDRLTHAVDARAPAHEVQDLARSLQAELRSLTSE
ncbi:MAG: hypothetical protein N2Z82_10080 [Thermomicrobium sp.]|nr:hypothetical protein [Thermomicrobium sp.]